MSRTKIIGAVVLLLVVAVGGAFFMQRQGGEPPEAIASADSTRTGGENAGADTANSDDQAENKKDDDEEKKDPPVPVELVMAEPRDIPSYFNATGSLEAQRQVQLISKAGGQIVCLLVEEGNTVRKGQVLLEIDHQEEKLLAEQTQVKAETARREFERSRGLVEKGLGSDRDFEEKRQRAEVAELDHNLAQVRLDNKIVRAPFSGQITLRHVELGQTVNIGEELLDIADVSPLEVRIYLPEKVVKDLNPGQPVEIRSDVDPDTPFQGLVERIAPSVDPATSTVKVTLEVPKPAAAARVGSFIRARITTSVAEAVVSVPKRALVPEAGVNYLFVAEGDSVLKVPVTTGYADDDYIEITGGISLGQKIVTVGQGGLRHGSKIKDLAQDTEDASDKEMAKAGSGEDYAAAKDQ